MCCLGFPQAENFLGVAQEDINALIPPTMEGCSGILTLSDHSPTKGILIFERTRHNPTNVTRRKWFNMLLEPLSLDIAVASQGNSFELENTPPLKNIT